MKSTENWARVRDRATQGYTPLEASKQRTFLRFCNAHEVGAVAGKTHMVGRRGYPDLTIHLPEAGDTPALTYFVEWKRNPRSVIAKQQKIWRDRLRALGCRVSVHHNLGEAKDEFLAMVERKSNFIGGGMNGED